MMKCRLCGTQLPQSANYCPVCGMAVLHKASSALTSSSPSSEAVANAHTRHQKRGLTPDAWSYKGKQRHLSSETVRESTRPRPLLSLPLSRRRSKATLVIGIALLVFALVGSGLFVFAPQRDLLQNPYPPYRGTLVLNNPLRENNNGYYHWTQTTLSNLSCRFMGGAYHIIESGDSYGRLCAVTGIFRDFASEIQMTIVKGGVGGIVFRTDSAYTKGYYFLINTIGEYILTRIDGGRPNSAKLLGHGSISAFHNGLNQSNLIAVVVQGNNIDLFVNQKHIIHINDGIYRQGQIGVIAEGRNNEAEVVFRNAKVWMLAQPVTDQSTTSVIASVGPSQNPYPPYVGTLALKDSLSGKNNNYQWDTGTDDSGDSCRFSGGAYHVSLSTQYRIYLCGMQIDFRKFSYQVQMTIVQGDGGGIAFCSDTTIANFYHFSISRLGTYALDVYKNKSFSERLSWGFSSVFHTGLHQTNLIAIVSNGGNIDLYVNRQIIASASDSTYSHGSVGVAADENINPTEVVFSNAEVWKL